MVSRPSYSINRFSNNEWVMQEMDTNTGDIADDMNEIVWWVLKWLVFTPFTLTWYTYKLLKKHQRERL